MPVWSAFVLGLFGSLHCAGMCGPLVFALHQGASSSGRWVYHMGRILTYALLGTVLGILGWVAATAGLQKIFSLVLGCGLLASVFIPLISTRFHSHYLVSRTGGWVAGRVKKGMAWAMTNTTAARQLFLGALNGLLPCGMVYVAIAGAISQASYLHSSLYMILFGLGTWPLLLAISSTSQLSKWPFTFNVKRLAPFFIAFLGIFLIWRGLGMYIEFIPAESSGINPFAGISICRGA